MTADQPSRKAALGKQLLKLGVGIAIVVLVATQLRLDDRVGLRAGEPLEGRKLTVNQARDRKRR